MDVITKFFLDISNYLNQFELGEKDPILLIALFVSILSLLLSLISLRIKSSGPKVTNQSSQRLNSNVHELNLKISDLTGRFGTAQTKLEEQVKHLQLQLSSLEAKLSIPESEIDKKKTKSSNLVSGLEKTRHGLLTKLNNVFSNKLKEDATLFEELEELLIKSDIGVKTSQLLIDKLRKNAANNKKINEVEIISTLKESIFDIVKDSSTAKIVPSKQNNYPFIILVVGVNGVGKTTTIAKLANQFKESGSKVLIAACDTFRAAAKEQLTTWADKIGVDVVGSENIEGEKPSTVAYRAMHEAMKQGYDVLLIDTAGRLHTKINLMHELENVLKIISKEIPGAPHECILVVDATTGQNALQQATQFNQSVPLTGVIITKLDGTAKGGVVIGIKNELKVPIRYLGIGESEDDLKVFSPTEFVEALFLDDTTIIEQSTKVSAHAKIRRKRKEELLNL
jgi:fused signal recognition particle receptor